MENNQSFNYRIAKQEIDESIAKNLHRLLKSGEVSRAEILDLFGPEPLELAKKLSENGSESDSVIDYV